MLEISTVVVASPYTSFMSHNVVEHLVELDYYFRVHSFIGERFSESSHVQVHAGALCRKPLTTSVHSRQLKWWHNISEIFTIWIIIKLNYVPGLCSKFSWLNPGTGVLLQTQIWLYGVMQGEMLKDNTYRNDFWNDPTVEMTLLYNFTTPSAPSFLFGRISHKIPEIGCTLNLQKGNELPNNSVAKGLPHSLFPLNGYTMFQVSGETNIFSETMALFEKSKDGSN